MDRDNVEWTGVEGEGKEEGGKLENEAEGMGTGREPGLENQEGKGEENQGLTEGNEGNEGENGMGNDGEGEINEGEENGEGVGNEKKEGEQNQRRSRRGKTKVVGDTQAKGGKKEIRGRREKKHQGRKGGHGTVVTVRDYVGKSPTI